MQYGIGQMNEPFDLLVSVSGTDQPGIAADLFEFLSTNDWVVTDIEQVQVNGRLLLSVGITTDVDQGTDSDYEHVGRTIEEVLAKKGNDVTVSVRPTDNVQKISSGDQYLVTLLAPKFTGNILARIFRTIAITGTNVDRIVRLASYPVVSYELSVSGGSFERLRRDLAGVATQLNVDVAVQSAGLHRRSKHLIVLDMDSTLIQGEVIDLLAVHSKNKDEVESITEAAMAGKLDFEAALIQRVALLAGLDESVLDDVRSGICLTPGARTLIRILKRLGYETAIVSGGFTQLIDPIAEELGIDYVAANRLEVQDGKLSGRLIGPIIDRAGKAAALVNFARQAGLSLSQTIAVGDGANDVDMLGVAGLGIAFNAKPIVRDIADTSVNVPYLDAILFFLGISQSEIEATNSLEAMN